MGCASSGSSVLLPNGLQHGEKVVQGVAGSDPVVVTFHMLQGEEVGTASVEPSTLGRGLVLQARALRGHGIVTLIHSASVTAVREQVPVGEQGLQGAPLQLVLSPIDEATKQRVMETVVGGAAHVEEWQVWDSIQTLTLDKLPLVSLPSALQSLTFGDSFNQSLDNVTLPGALQSLTFGWEFNQRLGNVTLPSALQSLTFTSHHHPRLENVNLPSGCQICRT